jgi:hypothetical protein
MTVDLDRLRTVLAAVATEPDEIPSAQVPGLVAELARAQAALLTAVNRPSAHMPRQPERPSEDRMLEVGEAAAGGSRRCRSLAIPAKAGGLK